MDRGKAGTKRHQVVDKKGLPLATLLSGANVPDGQKLLAVVDAIPSVRGKRGRPRHRPQKVHADKAYDDKKLRRGLRKRGIEPRLARRGVESGEKLGRHRWVAERTISWLNWSRRLSKDYEQTTQSSQAWIDVSAIRCALRKIER